MADDELFLIAARSRVAALRAVLEKTEGAPVRLIETHISWVSIAGALAYKIKKPVQLPFLDFRTLASRRYFCDEDLRLNLRLAPDLYLDVIDVRDGPAGPCFGGEGPLLDFAVRMIARGSDPRLAITHGLPGSGKTFISQLLLEEVGAVRVRSDVERKRLFGLSALQSSRERVPGGIYDAATTQQTYSRMLAVARIPLWPPAGRPSSMRPFFAAPSGRSSRRRQPPMPRRSSSWIAGPCCRCCTSASPRGRPPAETLRRPTSRFWSA